MPSPRATPDIVKVFSHALNTHRRHSAFRPIPAPRSSTSINSINTVRVYLDLRLTKDVQEKGAQFHKWVRQESKLNMRYNDIDYEAVEEHAKDIELFLSKRKKLKKLTQENETIKSVRSSRISQGIDRFKDHFSFLIIGLAVLFAITHLIHFICLFAFVAKDKSPTYNFNQCVHRHVNASLICQKENYDFG